MLRTPVVSSNIRSVGHDGVNMMEIEFNNGGVYQYSAVPYSLYSEFLASGSKGQFFHARIKNAFGYTQVSSQPSYDDDDDDAGFVAGLVVEAIADSISVASDSDSFSGGGGDFGGGGASADW